MLLAVELQMSGVYVSLSSSGPLHPSKLVIRHRKIALYGEHIFF